MLKLLQAAQQSQKNAYAPYSSFQVGSAILTDSDHIFTGCNVENVAYPLGQCAEASAISAMINAGSKKIQKILIASPNEEYCPPCGGCRQKIKEFSDQNTQIIMANNQGKTKSVTIAELLPLAFDMPE
ncbi:cytidine deaminase [Aliiglaciecola litoralis]